jgi:N-carbamoylputrescine amidase
LQIRYAGFIDILRGFNNARHGGFDVGTLQPGRAQHERQNIGIEHPVNRNSFGGGGGAGHLANRVHQRLPVMRTGPPHQRAIDVKQNQRAGQISVYFRLVAVTPDKFRIGLIQMACTEDPQANLDHAVDKIREAAQMGAQIICLQELFRSQYFCREEDARLFDLAEPIPGPSTDRLCPLAAELGVVIIASLFEKRATGLYHNTAVIIDADGRQLGIYRKMHVPDDPLFFEKFYFTPGDLGFRAFDTKFGRIAALVCWDQWYPEAARLASLTGANILFYPTAIGWHPAEKAEYGEAQHDAWRTAQRAHAIANGIYVAAVNRVGFEGPPERGLEFWGASFVSDPFGRVLAEASHDKEEILVVECDVKKIEEVRRNWPFLRDRRIDAYGPITSRFLA